MQTVGRILGAVAVIALLAGPAWGQQARPPAYGETDKDKTPSEKAAEKEAERAYRRSLGNIPEQKSSILGGRCAATAHRRKRRPRRRQRSQRPNPPKARQSRKMPASPGMTTPCLT
ncbi:hypothetical protein [Bradyrhizobium sp. RDI18]|uniref:hypothetical protein n=1 Tax=Bradyrhizobium sp. RDI18 TaxID=3367400 RepID=UPI003723AC5D